jgi:RNA polymerase sigma factor (sigma-70 family)
MNNPLVHPDERDNFLIEKALGGSKTALGQLIKNHYNFVYNVALRFTLNPDDAQDLTQEVLVRAITKLSTFEGQSAFRSWLYRIVFNHFLNSKRRPMEDVITSFDGYGEALDSIPLSELSPLEQMSLSEEVEDARLGCMTGMLMCLKREQRLIYILGEIFSVDSKTGSELLAMTADNFRQILSRARKDLYQFMHGKCGLINKNNPCRCPKKTRGFIRAGWVNQENRQFNNHYRLKISEMVPERANQCDDLMEERYGALFKDHPYYDRDKSEKLLAQILNDNDIKAVFHL